mgnify:CR=1 FL=1
MPRLQGLQERLPDAHRHGELQGRVPVALLRAARAPAPPTRAEIAAGLGFSTASSAEDHLQALARKGAIELIPGASRGLRIRDVPGMPVQGTLPLVGRVAAGHPILAVENIEARCRVDPALFSPRADYLLRVRGQSMRDAGILDGDLLAVHRSHEARSGQIVVARIGGAGGDEVTVKRLRKRGRDIVLMIDSLTRMGRAFNNRTRHRGEPRGHTMTGGLEAGVLEVPRRLFGLARNIENGGSVTIIATSQGLRLARVTMSIPAWRSLSWVKA